MLAMLNAAPAGSIQTGLACTPSSTTLELKWNMFASEWGGYEVDGCTGVNPKLVLTAGTTYTFDQSDASNWYHPVGFAYIAGGAHTECVDSDGNVGECPELGGESGASTLQYFVDGEAMTADESGFGLDDYEPLFFNEQSWWAEHAFKVTLTLPADATYTRVYYFCHIHAGMSAEIEVAGSSAGATTVLDASMLGSETEASALAIFDAIVAAEQQALSTFDETCGTHASVSFSPTSAGSCVAADGAITCDVAEADCEHDWYAPGSVGSSGCCHCEASCDHSLETATDCTYYDVGTCYGKEFLCGAGSHGTFETCLQAIDCQMHHDMAVSVPSGASKFATFARQMIPHHQNAVAMAKALAKHQTSADYPDTEDMDMAWANNLIREIINVQNFQIQGMQGWLESNPGLAGTSTYCYEGPSPPPPPPPSASPHAPPTLPLSPPTPVMPPPDATDGGGDEMAVEAVIAIAIGCAVVGLILGAVVAIKTTGGSNKAAPARKTAATSSSTSSAPSVAPAPQLDA